LRRDGVRELQKNKDSNTHTRWLNLDLKNPLVLGSLTLVSHTNILDQIDFYKRAAGFGISAIILESFAPVEYGESKHKIVANTICSFNNSLSKHNEKLGFSLLGPVFPNVSSIRYGINLFRQLKNQLKIPIICSLINIGNEESLIKWAKILEDEGVDALEFNFSCPNISIHNNSDPLQIIPFSSDLLNSIRSEIKIPFSIKTDPYFLKVDSKLVKNITNLTFSNAHIGLHPPSLDKPFNSQFGNSPDWSYTGIYGSYNRLITYKNLAMLKKEYPKLSVSVSGGVMEENNLIEALLLGADTIQLASVIMLKGLQTVESMLINLYDFMELNSFKSIEEFRGKSLQYINNTIGEIDAFKSDNVIDHIKSLPKVSITPKCIHCKDCVDRGCLAIKVNKYDEVFIDQGLCSHCGLCKMICEIEGALM
jgi:dihydroorotate dehydrogenase